MRKYNVFILFIGFALVVACSKTPEDEAAMRSGNAVSEQVTENNPEPSLPVEGSANPVDTSAASYRAGQYDTLRRKITYGNATLAEVRRALTEDDPAALTNTVHALYSMRWHRGVFKLLYDLWELKRNKYPEINWKEIEKPPVRLALASTLNRIQISDTKVFQDYIRSFEDHKHEFIRAQVVVALGFNGDRDDIPYFRSMITGENDYVAQSAITGLGLMNNNEARDALLELRDVYPGILREAYGWIADTNVDKNNNSQ